MWNPTSDRSKKQNFCYSYRFEKDTELVLLSWSQKYGFLLCVVSLARDLVNSTKL